LAAIATSSVASILERADTVEQRLLARYGLVVAALNEDEMAFFKVKGGVVVREVWTGYRADQASLMPGDIIGELDGAQVAEAADLRAMTNAPGERSFALTVQRGAKTVTVTIPHKSEGSWPVSAAEPGVGLNVESPPKGYSIDSVVPGSRAAAAGIEPGDRLIRIDHAEPQNVAQVRRVLARDQATPVLLDIERDGRRLAILVR
ncbi:MAG: PDZ domain-containing protein, partial [Acidobacteriota bacterium]|nr:PDZ domain-containing protein [Acidobacteriota bacterium]